MTDGSNGHKKDNIRYDNRIIGMTSMTTETREYINRNFMKCIACGMPTLMKYRKGEIEAAFCGEHVPREERRSNFQITILIKNYS